MASPAPPQGVLTVVPAPADIAAAATAFVRRIDPGCGGVVRILPELRVSLQVQAADPYWIQEQGDAGAWRQVPRVSAWGPRHDWAWGYARRDISAFGVLLTPAGLAALTAAAAPRLVNRTFAVADLDAELAVALDASAEEPFERWTARATAALRTAFGRRPPAAEPTGPALEVLATAEGDATAQAAAACGLSVRHFRRLFRDAHGTSPKLYQRLMRVDRKLRELHARPWEADPWPDEPIAFADQPHAIREFRALTGMTPRDYARAKAAGDATLRSVAGLTDAPAGPEDGG
ncbi:AraC family transcriptional regulator [Phenylobacterium sp. J426]|uniref:helix-turn-helix domain-containing protein n=1 Tax=Phenylobacterium sp. J426 TaxID=2898439 RepID=UPI002150F78C|nr:AraC family transcriptional regulator [Phenylobacterium sp. J426]MCR5873054.1 AraC family transcriptional regulator [Phenylobacterium sp. J426]